MTAILPHQKPTTPSCADESQHTCCSLDTPVRPRFFCGQLLTDTDLGALVDWTADKLSLARYRHGWGVVCGLDVRCDPTKPGGVIISPGYAISCCGDDIIVAEDYRYDLSNACGRQPAPCEDPAGSAYHEHTSKAEAVDLYICYREEGAEPQTALAHRVCGEGGACEHSRTKELFALTVQPVEGDQDPVSAAAKRWEARYDACLGVLTAYINRFSEHQYYDQKQTEAIQQWLLKWIDDHPLTQFCSLREEICQLGTSDKVTEGDIARLLFYLVQDCRNAYLTCNCHTCDTIGVPLARAWLRSQEEDRRCHVVSIDPYPPYRRPLRQDCWPAPLGWTNVGQVIWHRWGEACTTLVDLGVHVVDTVQFEIPETVAELRKVLACRPFVDCREREEVVVQLYESESDGSTRVVGFCGTPDQYESGTGRPNRRPIDVTDSSDSGEAEEQDTPSDRADSAEAPSDELQQIDGIGPAYAAICHEAGYRTLAELSRVSENDLRPLFGKIVTNEALSSWIQEASKRAAQ